MEDSTEIPQSSQVCSFLRKPSRNKNIRKRTTNEDETAEPEGSVSQNHRRPYKAVESNRESDGAIFHYECSKEIQVQHDSRATAALETETEFSKDARAICERVLKQAEEVVRGKAKRLYKGLNGYTDFKAGFRREHTVASEKAGGSHGPLRASAHIRTSTRFDYQPDICKDYKETGYCGYGGSCKFVHDRGDYKSGLQMEKEWDEAGKAGKRKLALRAGNAEGEDVDQNEDGEGEDALPLSCFICRQRFVDPVVTKCNHYLCEHCALKIRAHGVLIRLETEIAAALCRYCFRPQRHARNKKCFVCNQATMGVFNAAREIRKRNGARASLPVPSAQPASLVV